ncbi:uncharacterized protein LY89DRAFT_585234 [Mollisia scopiformis]|uniref:CorA-like transporter domain-containing protein n=1 Tax=Mollisia scopiformis TaxID=149040 RepID=A0A194XAE5_MOLSC|nr:uncharacterized protein LY89DRAFT_585234 [Mollisia scopiformis]KUJ17136.1 hypothetical protein LY89DRAFT_585234 [Mollisia scopiformis]
MYTLTYHQVMPAFLDFIFPFGQQIYTRDFFFGGIRHENRLLDSDLGPDLPKLRRSGQEIRVCYSLKSVEKTDEPGEKHSPWSVRQTATYHSFDVETGSALWISVKGNDLIQDRVMTATENLGPDQRPFSTKERAFEEAMSIHLINCKWAGEQWRWYLNYLEEELQGGAGRRALSAKVVRERRPEEKEKLEFLRARSMSTKGTSKGRSGMTTFCQSPKPQPNRTRSASRESGAELDGHSQFSFDDSRDIQSLEDKTNEAIFVLNANIDVLGELKVYYHDLVVSQEHVKLFASNHNRVVERFGKQITSIINDLRMQITRAGALLRMLSDRKALVSLYGILNYRNAAASMTFAAKSQESANNMERMTRKMEELTVDMNELAQKTTQETVSMRIITLVTLFFLPGTFISTIMSTDIVRFQGPNGGPGPKTFQAEALKLYVYITLPMMLLTFAAWFLIYKLESRKADKKRRRKSLEKQTAENV